MNQPNTLFSNFCGFCGSFNLSERLEPRYEKHCEDLHCNDCHKLTKKVTAPQEKAPEPSIVRLLKSPNLEQWERAFLKTIAYQRKLTSGEKFMIRHISNLRLVN